MDISFQLTSIDNIAQKIIDTKPRDSHQLIKIVEISPGMRDELLPYHDFDHPKNESYGRRLIYESSFFCIYLMSWCPGDFTAIHDHGSTQWGCVLALDDFAHRLYEFNNNYLRLKDDSPFLTGQTARVQSDIIHMMGNTSNKNALSVHIYGTNNPDLTVAQHSCVFYPEINQLTYTQGAAFLYDPTSCSHELHDFNTIEKETLSDYYSLLFSNKTPPRKFNVLY